MTFKPFTLKQSLGIFASLVLAIGLILAVIGAQQQQDQRSKASGFQPGQFMQSGRLESNKNGGPPDPVIIGVEPGATYKVIVTGTYYYNKNQGTLTDAQWDDWLQNSKNCYCRHINKVEFNGYSIDASNYTDSVARSSHSFTYLWTAPAVTTSLQLLIPDTYYIDNSGGFDYQLYFQSPPPVTNKPPVANPGGNKEVIIPQTSVTLNGTASSDPDGTISSYSWTRKSGPDGATIVQPTAATTTITGLVEGVYEFQLEVTDNGGAKNAAAVTVTVTRAPNVGPSANAGPDQTINLPADKVTLTGSGTDSDGTITDYTWTKISGPDDGYIESAYTPETIVSGLVVGEYNFKFDVVDNDGVHGFDTVKITVKPAVPTNFIFDVFMHGIGKSGDNSNPTGGGGNMNLLHFQRQLIIEVYDTQNQLKKTDEGILTFNSTSGSFKGKVDMGTDLLSGPYTVKVKMKQSLKAQIPGIQIVTAGVDKVMPTVTLMTGDINGDNSLNILDYDILDGCYSDLTPAENCTPDAKLQADITDDGFVNQLDYSLFIRELSNIGGQ